MYFIGVKNSLKIVLILFYRFPKWPLSFWISSQNFLFISYLSHAWFKLRPKYPLFHRPNNIYQRAHVIKLDIMHFAPTSFMLSCFLSLGLKYSLGTLYPNTINSCSSHTMKDQISRSRRTTDKHCLNYGVLESGAAYPENLVPSFCCWHPSYYTRRHIPEDSNIRWVSTIVSQTMVLVPPAESKQLATALLNKQQPNNSSKGRAGCNELQTLFFLRILYPLL
jgi:hypothetical protein